MLSLTTVLGEMEQMTGLLDRIVQFGGRQVISTGYDELRAFFVDPISESSEISLTALANLLTEERDGSVESIRKGRAEAILAYLKLANLSTQAGVPDTLTAELRGWRASERSGGVQRVLDEALALLEPRG
jgi:proteasome component ECM29